MKIMIYDAAKTLRVDTAEDKKPQKGQVVIKTLVSGISHGTEMNIYRGAAPFFRRKYNAETRLFEQAQSTETWGYPVRSCDDGVWYMGYAAVGEIVEKADDVQDFEVGDIVYSAAPHQSHSVSNASDIISLKDVSDPKHAIFFTNLMTSYNAVLDGKIKLGDTVVVSGMGVLGQMIAQLAKLNGAFKVYVIDTIDKRLHAALENGADKAFNPKTCDDIALEIRKLTDNRGADVVFEVSGNAVALNEAIRIAAPETAVVAVGWYQGEIKGLDLSEEFHHNRISIKQTQTNHMAPEYSHLWDNARRSESCVKLLSMLKLDNLISHRIDFDDVASAYKMVDETPQDIIQVMLTY